MDEAYFFKMADHSKNDWKLFFFVMIPVGDPFQCGWQRPILYSGKAPKIDQICHEKCPCQCWDAFDVHFVFPTAASDAYAWERFILPSHTVSEYVDPVTLIICGNPTPPTTPPSPPQSSRKIFHIKIEHLKHYSVHQCAPFRVPHLPPNRYMYIRSYIFSRTVFQFDSMMSSHISRSTGSTWQISTPSVQSSVCCASATHSGHVTQPPYPYRQYLTT